LFIDSTDNSSRLKHAQQGLRASFPCQECAGIIEQHRISSDPDDYTETFAQEAQRLLSILNGRIQTFLKELVKIYKLTNAKKSIYEDYKEMYSISLRINDKAVTFPKDLYDVIERLKKIYEKNSSD
jgi:thiamine biosynthesis lipoprotein ApbE